MLIFRCIGSQIIFGTVYTVQYMCIVQHSINNTIILYVCVSYLQYMANKALFCTVRSYIKSHSCPSQGKFRPADSSLNPSGTQSQVHNTTLPDQVWLLIHLYNKIFTVVQLIHQVFSVTILLL